jgi:hypothetical protein
MSMESVLSAQLHQELISLRNEMNARFDAMDKATVLLNENLTRVPTDVDKQILHIKALYDDRFASAGNARDRIGEGFISRLESVEAGIQKQFDERDVRSRASDSASSTAVNAALQAQKEAASAQNEANAAAITKSEAAYVKQIDGILALLASDTKAIDEKISAINGRLDRGEGAISSHSSTQATIIAIISVFVSVMIGGYSVISSFHNAPGGSFVTQSAPSSR